MRHVLDEAFANDACRGWLAALKAEAETLKLIALGLARGEGSIHQGRDGIMPC